MAKKKKDVVDNRRLWQWLDRSLPELFFQSAGHLKKRENERRWNEIPTEIKPLAYTMIRIAVYNAEHKINGKTPFSCLLFRCEVYGAYTQLKKKGIDIHLPYSWFMDGPMIEPEWIVRITNGIIGWTCDSSVVGCGKGMMGDCRYYEPPVKSDKKGKKQKVK